MKSFGYKIYSALLHSGQTIIIVKYTLYNNQISAPALIGQSAMAYCASKLKGKITRRSPVTRDLRIIPVFSQHPSWFISL